MKRPSVPGLIQSHHMVYILIYHELPVLLHEAVMLDK